jgi:hypothetical protein
MKNKIKNLLYVTLMLLPGSFLATVSAPAMTPMAPPESVYGGAFIVFAGKFGGEISRQEIASHSEVTVDGCAKGSRIFQFTLHVTKSGRTSTLSSKSNFLTDEMIARLKSLSKGDAFEFKNTKAFLPNNRDAVDVHGKKFIVV